MTTFTDTELVLHSLTCFLSGWISGYLIGMLKGLNTPKDEDK